MAGMGMKKGSHLDLTGAEISQPVSGKSLSSMFCIYYLFPSHHHAFFSWHLSYPESITLVMIIVFITLVTIAVFRSHLSTADHDDYSGANLLGSELDVFKNLCLESPVSKPHKTSTYLNEVISLLSLDWNKLISITQHHKTELYNHLSSSLKWSTVQ